MTQSAKLKHKLRVAKASTRIYTVALVVTLLLSMGTIGGGLYQLWHEVWGPGVVLILVGQGFGALLQRVLTKCERALEEQRYLEGVLKESDDRAQSRATMFSRDRGLVQ